MHDSDYAVASSSSTHVNRQYTVFVAICTICGSIKHESVTTITTGYTQRELQRGHAVLI